LATGSLPDDPDHGSDDGASQPDGSTTTGIEGTAGSSASTGAASTGVPQEEDPDACEPDPSRLLWAADAELSEPMRLVEAPDYPGEPQVAVSTVADAGHVTFKLDVECPGLYHLHGLVWDAHPGAWAHDDPDSFFVSIAAGAPFVWRYGCQTSDTAAGLSWQALGHLNAQPCEQSSLVLEVSEPGPVIVDFRNREGGERSDVAGLAALFVSSDPDEDPHGAYDF